MALYLVLLPILLTTMVAASRDDELPFNITGLTPIYVQKDGSTFISNSRHHGSTGSKCNTVTFLPGGTSSVFTSPRYPGLYPSNQRCQYVFKSLDHSCNIQIQCSFFQLPWSYTCSSHTNLFMKWGFGLNERKCYCGSTIPPTVVSSSYWAYAKFSSIWWYNLYFRGFRCTASSICPTTTTATTTVTTSAATTTGAPTTTTPSTTMTTTVDTTTSVPTTAAPTTAAPTTVAPTTAAPTTVAPTTAAPTTAAPTTVVATTVVATTVAPTTAAPTTAAPTTAAPTTVVATTVVVTTIAPTTAVPTTVAATTIALTTATPTTSAQTTPAPTTAAATTTAAGPSTP